MNDDSQFLDLHFFTHSVLMSSQVPTEAEFIQKSIEFQSSQKTGHALKRTFLLPR